VTISAHPAGLGQRLDMATLADLLVAGVAAQRYGWLVDR
jgi:hypothetical protein